jgi:hypothetical protein
MKASVKKAGIEDFREVAVQVTDPETIHLQDPYVDTVLGYGLSRDVATVVEKACEAVGADFFNTAILTDIFAVPHILLVCNFSALDKQQLKYQFACMNETAKYDYDFSWILLGAHAMKPPRRILAAKVQLPDPPDEQHLKVVLLRQQAAIRKRKQKAHQYDQRLFRLLSSLKKLRTQRFVKTKDLCREFNVNPRTVARDMKMLEYIGEFIMYDPSTKAYRYYGDETWPGRP